MPPPRPPAPPRTRPAGPGNAARTGRSAAAASRAPRPAPAAAPVAAAADPDNADNAASTGGTGGTPWAGGPGAVPLHRLLQRAADAVAAVRAGRSLTEALAAVPVGERPGTQALAFHALRHLGAAHWLRQRLAPREPPPAVQALLLTALALLWPPADGAPPPYPPHTLVDQAVAAARRRTPAAAGFVNAVLRRFGREREALLAAGAEVPEVRHQHPAWWIDRLRADWPAAWPALLAQANRPAPMVLRVNRHHGDAAGYCAQLAAQGLAARPVPGHPDAVRLAQPCAVQRLPGFSDGWVSVQDLSAQLAAPLLLGAGEPDSGLPALPPGARVLDACAAPGGKTAHLLEHAELDLLALDQDDQRLARVADNLRRLRLSAELRCADAARPDGWWDGRPFDAILLDAPCSASGIVRRHPDVRWLRRPGDIPALAATQARLLDALWPLLKPGGRLLYATCSLFRDEGAHQIDAFLQRTRVKPARLAPASPGHLTGLPDNPGPAPAAEACAPDATGDGFFYALLTAPG